LLGEIICPAKGHQEAIHALGQREPEIKPKGRGLSAR
jgi:hypothetical protein